MNCGGRSLARSISRDHAPVAEAASGPARAVPALEIAADARLARRPAVVPLDPARDVFRAGLPLAIVERFVVIDAAALAEHVAVLDGGEMAEDVLAAAVRRDEAEAAIVPSPRDSRLARAGSAARRRAGAIAAAGRRSRARARSSAAAAAAAGAVARGRGGAAAAARWGVLRRRAAPGAVGGGS
eukprot:31369-Pelagococcus_subviridis.AAC.6